MKRSKKSSLTTQYVLTISVLLLLTNIVLGLVLMHQSTEANKKLIRKNMLDMSNTAAGLLDGDALGALTEADVGGEAFNDVYNKLSVFQNNNDIQYIYAVRQVDGGRFVFTVDPDPVNPGEFGEEVLVTEALRSAGMGVAMVDNSPAEDSWGNFYSAFSPVFDSNGNVAGVVGVDFDSAWYDQQIRENTVYIGVLTLLFLLTGVTVVLAFTRRIRRRFDALGQELSVLSSGVDELMGQIVSTPALSDEARPEVKTAGAADERFSDEMEELGRKIRSMQGEMERYLDYVHAQAYTDALTKVGNTTAYMELQKQLEELIHAHTGSFGVAMFDINLLKRINDQCGHACGDRVIRGAAGAIAEVFGAERTFRIGGDEFLAVVYQVTEAELAGKLAQVDEGVLRFNQEAQQEELSLSLSKGASVYLPGQDGSFREVFVRADQMMYRQKEEFHRQVGDFGRA